MENSFDIGAFYNVLDAEREERKLSWRQLARESGVASSSVFTRLAKGYLPDGENLLAILRWSGIDIRGFFDGGETKELSTLAAIALALQKDQRLDAQGKALIDEMVRSMYNNLCK